MKFKFLAVAAALVLLAAACNKTASQTPQNQESQNQQQSQLDNSTANQNQDTPANQNDGAGQNNASASNPQAGTVIVTITSGGFNPATITVKAGTTVVFQNNDSKPHWPASNPHPIHTDLSGFDSLRGVVSGSSYSYTFAKIGTWAYHDHLHPNLGGKVIVQ